MNCLAIEALFDLNNSAARPLLSRFTFPWEVLPEIGTWIRTYGETLSSHEYTCVDEAVWISNEAKRYPNTYIAGPAVIGPGTEIRPGAFLRGNVLVGAGCVVGNSTELKNVILFDCVQVPHYNYVGDSILGYKAHMGAGAITSNVKQDKTNITLSYDGQRIESGLRKFGAILGDHVKIGCNSVLNPGTVIGKHSRVYPLSMVRGYVPADTIHKNDGNEILIRS